VQRELEESQTKQRDSQTQLESKLAHTGEETPLDLAEKLRRGELELKPEMELQSELLRGCGESAIGLHEVDRLHNGQSMGMPVWECLVDGPSSSYLFDRKWVSYPAEICQTLEAAHASGAQLYEFCHRSNVEGVLISQLDFAAMEQVNTTSGTRRKVRRRSAERCTVSLYNCVVRSLYIKIQEYQLHPSKDGLRYMRQLQLSQAAIDEHKLKSWRIEELKIDVCS
jgi:hypothetical protein